MSNEESLIIKIKKLIDHSHGTDNEKESQAFMLRAMELMRQHNIDIQRVEMAEEQKKQRIEAVLISFEDKYYEHGLLKSISENNFCRIILNYDETGLYVIGKSENVEIVIYLFTFYKRELLRLSITAYNKHINEKEEMFKSAGLLIDDFPKTRFKNTFLRDYVIGAVSGISEKMNEDKQNAINKNISNSTGLISLKDLYKINEQEIEKYVEEKFGKLTKSIRSNNSNVKNDAAFNSGKKDGKGINSRFGVYGQGSINESKQLN